MTHRITLYLGQLGVSGLPYFVCSCGLATEKRGGMTHDPAVLEQRRTHYVWDRLRSHVEGAGQRYVSIQVA